jgi:hypothetical protein
MKPQINLNVNLNFDGTDNFSTDTAPIIACIMAFKEALNQIKDDDPAHDSPHRFEPLDRPHSRHQQAVTANQRISDALEFINKSIRLMEGANDAAQRRNLEEIKRILLGM